MSNTTAPFLGVICCYKVLVNHLSVLVCVMLLEHSGFHSPYKLAA